MQVYENKLESYMRHLVLSMLKLHNLLATRVADHQKYICGECLQHPLLRQWCPRDLKVPTKNDWMFSSCPQRARKDSVVSSIRQPKGPLRSYRTVAGLAKDTHASIAKHRHLCTQAQAVAHNSKHVNTHIHMHS